MLKQVALLSVVAVTFTGCVVAPFDDGRYHSNQYGYANQYGYSGQYGGSYGQRYDRSYGRVNSPQHRPNSPRPNSNSRPDDTHKPNVQKPSSQHPSNVHRPSAKPQTPAKPNRSKPQQQKPQQQRPKVTLVDKAKTTGGFNSQRPLRPQV
ncbi:hypothetical protein [Acinetobacter sp. SH20PTE14]|uniref:hypothetical protein n=1 Tax=Acinetobacter sp. SH20PTE14 TaxID=2905879 RepID=UPI001F2EF509|nr:hypothetical protein [Acinetobacter sp. SH20PTE14]UIJ74897.1 hypothetical protein LXF01_11745 [Acinetobacter sp. SH20PTE14]